MSYQHALIATLPRSGTWMTRYLLLFFDHFFRSSAEPDISDIYLRATTEAQEFTVADQVRITLNHWTCPGVFDLDSPLAKTSLRFFEGMMAKYYHAEYDAANAAYKPPNGRVFYVFRHPLDVYRSYAEMHEQRSHLTVREDYPFNPMVPFGTAHFNTFTDDPFVTFIDGFMFSGFSEYFAAQYASFLAVQDAYPDRVFIRRYEDSVRDPHSHFRDLLERVGVELDARAESALAKALLATSKDAMRSYEEKLGHALSGKRTFYGELNATHLSRRSLSWRLLFGNDELDYLRIVANRYDPRIYASIQYETPSAGEAAPRKRRLEIALDD